MRRHTPFWTEEWLDESIGAIRRRLRDGSVHRAVKVLWRPRDLEQRLHALGWGAQVHAEGPFYWGFGSRVAASMPQS